MPTSRKYGPSDTLILVQAFAPYAEMVARHLPLWRRHGCRVVISSPRNSFCEISGVECVAHGEEGHAGPVSLDRWKEILRWLWGQPYEFFLMHESDSVCLSDRIPEYLYDNYDTFFSNELLDNANPPTQQAYCVAPWFFSRGVLRRVNVASEKAAYRPPFHGDRWVGQLLEEEGIPHRGFSPGVACGTLFPGSGDLPIVRSALRAGASMIHGVKSQIILDELIREFNV